MPTLHSHTHCQATPAKAKTQAWQRVCLSQRTTKTTNKSTDEKNTEAITAVLQKWRCSASYDSEVVNQNLVLRLKFSGKNRHLRKAAKRWATYKKSPTHKQHIWFLPRHRSQRRKNQKSCFLPTL